MLVVTPTALFDTVRLPSLFGEPQLMEEIEAGSYTILVNVQLTPPIWISKLAVPLLVGVPEIIIVRVPDPAATAPAAILAVNPVTPVDGTAIES
jgi:hypothetical protein